MRIAVFQVPYVGAVEAIRWQREQFGRIGAGEFDLIALPEYCNATTIDDPAELAAFAEAEGSAWVREVAGYAKKLRCAVAAGVVVRDGNFLLRNRLVLFNPEGELAGYADKIHLTGAEIAAGMVPADSVRIIEYNGLRIAPAICFDQYFAEYFPMLASRGVDLILAPSYQRGETAERIVHLARTRAVDSGAWLVRASYSVGDSPEFAGRSLVAGPDGELAVCAGGGPEVITAEFDPRRKFVKPASFGAPPVSHTALIEKHRREPFYRHTVFQAKSPSLCAHRGLSASLPENTVPAFAAALAAGADEIEFDIYQTADQVPVIVHDPDLRRVAGVDRRVEELAWHEIRALDLGKVYGDIWRYLRIPRLEEVLQLCDGSAGLNIHMKMAGNNGELVRQVAEALAKCNLREAAYIGGEADVLEAAIRFAPDITRSCMAEQGNPDALIRNAVKFGCRRLQFYSSNVTAAHVAEAHRHGIHCNVFYADTREEASRMIEMGIDTVLTNYAATFLNAPDSLFTRRDRR